MAGAELFANAVQCPPTTLAAAMTDTVGTTLTVASSAGFPSAVTNVGQFRVLIDTEYLVVTNVSGVTWTVTRGNGGSAAATHSSGAPVTHVLTAASLEALKVSLRDKHLKPSAALFETFVRSTHIPSAVVTTSGTLYLTALALPAGVAISSISFQSHTSGPGDSKTNWWFGLYDANRNQLATTADQLSTPWSVSTAKTLAIATTAAGAAPTFTTTYEGLYYLGFMLAGSLTPYISAVSSAYSGLVPITAGSSDTGQVGPPAFPHQAAAMTAIPALAYGMVG